MEKTVVEEAWWGRETRGSEHALRKWATEMGYMGNLPMAGYNALHHHTHHPSGCKGTAERGKF